jgi:UDP-N-acetylglucosamine 1-carboxyvinyltransferase
MGADIQLAGRAAMVTGVGALHGAAVRGTDLRGTAALVVAALGAQGRSTVEGLSYIRRGYEAFAPHLRALGAEIEEAEKETGESHGSSEEQTKTQTEQEPLRVSV